MNLPSLHTSIRVTCPTVWTAAAACLAVAALSAPALSADWPQWRVTAGENMASDEKGLPDSFVPGEKDCAEALANNHHQAAAGRVVFLVMLMPSVLWNPPG